MANASTSAPCSHNAAMQIIWDAGTVATLSHEEAIAVYLRARHILKDGETMLGAPIPQDWNPNG